MDISPIEKALADEARNIRWSDKDMGRKVLPMKEYLTRVLISHGLELNRETLQRMGSYLGVLGAQAKQRRKKKKQALEILKKQQEEKEQKEAKIEKKLQEKEKPKKKREKKLKFAPNLFDSLPPLNRH